MNDRRPDDELRPVVTIAPLAAEQLYRAADPAGLNFETTDELKPLEEAWGQPRAVEALRLGAGVAQTGFNVFAIGRPETGMRKLVRQVLEQAGRPGEPNDWVYVNNFSDTRRPIAIRLPAGSAPGFRDAMSDLVEDLKSAVPAVFESEDYQAERARVEEDAGKPQRQAFAELQERAAGQDLAIVRTSLGFAIAPARGGEIVSPEEFGKWPEEKREQTQARIALLGKELEHFIRQIPQWEKDRRHLVRELNRRTTQGAVGHLIEDRKAEFARLPRIVEHLEKVEADLVDNIGMFIAGGEDSESGGEDAAIPGGQFDRYLVNVLVTHAEGAGAPIVEELHPTLGNLTGSIEHHFRQGALITNFRLIKAGSLHRANGGYFLVDARTLLGEAFSWPALMRALRRREITIEDVSRLLGLSSTVSLEPEPIPLDVKVVLFGDRLLYLILAALAPEIAEHFQVLADFDDDVPRSTESEGYLARLIATLVKQEQLHPVDRGGVALLIEHAARLAENAGKLSMLIDQLRLLLAEASFRAGQEGRETVTRADVHRSIAERMARAARMRERLQEAALDRVALIETSGVRIGQINGLSVFEFGGHAFGHPTRISCRVRPGTGEVVDIEREVELGGPVHSKGVFILSGFLAGRYARELPMSLQASLVFEQSYGGVEGDSASAAELCALVSALAELPLRQDLAITGSVNQHGEIQAIGGINEKIEGFFALCQARGLTGTQGVVMPLANVRHLMLGREVVEACASGRFGIYAVADIDQCLQLMTAREAGQRDPRGIYPAASVNGLVEQRLRGFADVRRQFMEGEPGGSRRSRKGSRP